MPAQVPGIGVVPDCLKCRLDGVNKLAEYVPIKENEFHWWGQRVCVDCANELGIKKFKKGPNDPHWR